MQVKYYAGQFGLTGQGGTSKGVRSRILTQDLAMLDQSNDFIADWIGMTYVGPPLQWVQIGFLEGGWSPVGSYASPVPYVEYNDPGCTGYNKTALPYGNQGYHSWMEVLHNGQSATCGGTVKYVYKVNRLGIGPVGNNYYLSASSVRPDAFSEHSNWTHMEPGGIKCFGTNSSCGVTLAFETYLYSNNLWTQWTTSFPTSAWATGGYQYGWMNPYRNFFTGGQW